MSNPKPVRTCCGMRCDLCPAFKANRAGADLERASVVWASLFDVHLTPDRIACGGCHGQAEELLDQACPVRPCVLSKGLEDCSQCADMPCEKPCWLRPSNRINWLP